MARPGVHPIGRLTTGSVLARRRARTLEVIMRALLSVGAAVMLATVPLTGRLAPQPSAAPPGQALYRTHCATCHGTSGRGDGPMAQYLRVPPADLSSITARNKGVFPTATIQRIVDGRQMLGVHGSGMPIWGDAFSPAGNAAADEVAAAKIRAIVTYLESIQDRSGE
jgi:mono/diheme cytochrome c family protein